MKKRTCILLALCLCAALWGCQRETVKIESPVNFYYRQAEVSYGSPNGVIAPCVSEGAGYEEDLVGLLNAYLQGPADPEFRNPFPGGCKVLEVTVEEGSATVVLSSHLARYSGLKLTIACACLSLTVMDLTETDSVCIIARDALLDGAESITMTAEGIILLDLYDAETEEK